MKVKFIRDFGGRETGEIFYLAGQVANIEPLDLIERGICEIVPEPVEEKQYTEIKEQRPNVPATKKGKK